jgi:hypothetical protein
MRVCCAREEALTVDEDEDVQEFETSFPALQGGIVRIRFGTG